MIHIPRWQILAVLGLILFGSVFAAPNLMGRQTAQDLPNWLPHDQISLGLDLGGGVYLLLEADLEGAVEERLNDLAARLKADLTRAGLAHSPIRLQDMELTLKLADPAARSQLRQTVAGVSAHLVVRSSDDGTSRLTLSEPALRDLKNQVMAQVAQIIRIRLDETGTRERSVQRQGERRVVVQVPGAQDPEKIKDLLKTTAKLTFHLVEEDTVPGRDPIPGRARVLDSREAGPDGYKISYAVQKRIMVSGKNLVDAQATFQDNQPVVSFRFDSEGARRFGDATQKNVGKVFAVVLDDRVISAPVIREPILGGSGIISGRFTTQETEDLALLLRAGALPTTVAFLEERTVSPGLGAESVRAGQIASVLGLIFVIGFMALSYGVLGAIADIALIANLVLIVAALSALQATLTLPGIAGIVLTIGMAVDANVLIFERIREEASLGRSPVASVDAGYRRAMTTIMDSNLTTLIAAVLLFHFGTGPVKGFAVTLAIGIMASMFTAIMVTRLMIVAWLRWRKPQALHLSEPKPLVPEAGQHG